MGAECGSEATLGAGPRSLGVRLQLARRRFTRPTAWVAAGAAGSILGIDPYHLLIDLETGDNIVEVKIES